MFTRLIVGLIIIFGLSGTVLPKAHADESTTNKIKDTVDDTKTAAKKTARTGKRKVRQATGTDSLGKDAQDKINDVGDAAADDVSKAKHNGR